MHNTVWELNVDCYLCRKYIFIDIFNSSSLTKIHFKQELNTKDLNP